MKAIVIDKTDQSLHYTDVENPVLKAGEVLIETYAAAIPRSVYDGIFKSFLRRASESGRNAFDERRGKWTC